VTSRSRPTGVVGSAIATRYRRSSPSTSFHDHFLDRRWTATSYMGRAGTGRDRRRRTGRLARRGPPGALPAVGGLVRTGVELHGQARTAARPGPQRPFSRTELRSAEAAGTTWKRPVSTGRAWTRRSPSAAPYATVHPGRHGCGRCEGPPGTTSARCGEPTTTRVRGSAPPPRSPRVAAPESVASPLAARVVRASAWARPPPQEQ